MPHKALWALQSGLAPEAIALVEQSIDGFQQDDTVVHLPARWLGPCAGSHDAPPWSADSFAAASPTAPSIRRWMSLRRAGMVHFEESRTG